MAATPPPDHTPASAQATQKSTFGGIRTTAPENAAAPAKLSVTAAFAMVRLVPDVQYLDVDLDCPSLALTF